MILYPAEPSHYELHRKPHETMTDNSAIAVSLGIFISNAPPPEELGDPDEREEG